MSNRRLKKITEQMHKLKKYITAPTKSCVEKGWAEVVYITCETIGDPWKTIETYWTNGKYYSDGTMHSEHLSHRVRYKLYTDSEKFNRAVARIKKLSKS